MEATSAAPGPRTFHRLLANTLLVSVTNFTAWFAITFFVYLETRSVFATGVISGIYLAFSAASGIWFGSLVDHHPKKLVITGATAVSLALYVACLVLYVSVDRAEFTDPTSPVLWALVLLLMSGVIVGNIRTIAMPTLVTLLVAEDRRDRANGLVGTVSGVAFLVTSVISGLLVGWNGMLSTLILAIVVTGLSLVDLSLIRVPESRVAGGDDRPKRIDLRGTLAVVRAVPGLPALIVFTTVNNLLGGVFMALMDAYGLSLVSVQAWGFLWGVLSTGFIVGGLIIARRGLGANPLRSMLLANVVIWVISAVFTLRSSILLLAVGMFVYLCLMPYIEASEQTILQRVVPYERQGRVFGFAQSMEQSASPLTALLISPVAQFVFIPFMTTGAGVDLIGDWFGTGPERGIALVFTLTGVVGLVLTVLALRTRHYRLLSRHYLEGSAEPAPALGA